MNIFLRELRANLKSLITWCVITALFVMLGTAKFSAYYNNPDMLNVLNSLPQAVLDMLNTQAFNLTTVSGFFGIMYTYYALLLGIAAAMWGSDIIVKEERDKTVEFSLTLPVTRSRLVAAKSLAALTNCVVLLLVTWAASIISVRNYHPDAKFFDFLGLCMIALFLMELIFLSVGLFLGCVMRRYKLAASTAVSILLVTYFISIVSAIDKNLAFLKYFSPFKYFDPAVLLHESRFDAGLVALSLAIVAAGITAAFYSYSKRDLYI